MVQPFLLPPSIPPRSPWTPPYKPPPRAVEPPPSLLDSSNQKCTCAYQPCKHAVSAKKRRGRMYQRAMSGIRLGGDLRFLTLTTSEEAWEAGLSIQSAFRAIVMRMRRRGLLSGYIKVTEYTQLGRPHLHVLFRGSYIAQWMLSGWWKSIYLSPVVDIRQTQKGSGSARYLAKYMGKDPRARYSWSWDWVWKGFVKDWKALLVEGYRFHASMFDIIEQWGYILDAHGIKRGLKAP